MKNPKEKFFKDKEHAITQMRMVKIEVGNINKAISDENFEEAIKRLKSLKAEADKVIRVLK